MNWFGYGYYPYQLFIREDGDEYYFKYPWDIRMEMSKIFKAENRDEEYDTHPIPDILTFINNPKSNSNSTPNLILMGTTHKIISIQPILKKNINAGIIYVKTLVISCNFNFDPYIFLFFYFFVVFGQRHETLTTNSDLLQTKANV